MGQADNPVRDRFGSKPDLPPYPPCVCSTAESGLPGDGPERPLRAIAEELFSSTVRLRVREQTP